MSQHLAAILLAVAGTTNAYAATEAPAPTQPTSKICTVKNSTGNSSVMHSIPVADQKDCAKYTSNLRNAFSGGDAVGAYFEAYDLKAKTTCESKLLNPQPSCKTEFFAP